MRIAREVLLISSALPVWSQLGTASFTKTHKISKTKFWK